MAAALPEPAEQNFVVLNTDRPQILKPAPRLDEAVSDAPTLCGDNRR